MNETLYSVSIQMICGCSNWFKMKFHNYVIEHVCVSTIQQIRITGLQKFVYSDDQMQPLISYANKEQRYVLQIINPLTDTLFIYEYLILTIHKEQWDKLILTKWILQHLLDTYFEGIS